MNVDFIIVGQGIAGTSFAFELIKHNKTFVIVDQFKINTASRVALGIYNPLVLKWFTKAWDVDKQLAYFYDFYNDLNIFLGSKLYSDLGIYKFLRTPYDQNNWLAKQSNSNRSRYMSSELCSIPNAGLIDQKFYGVVKSAGRVDVSLLLNLFREHCINNNLLINKKLNYQDLHINSQFIQFEHVKSNNIIFCQGYSGINNPYFDNLRLTPTKGEILTIHSKDLKLKNIIHSGFLLSSTNNDYYSVGATYDWQDINVIPTLTAKKKLINNLKSVIRVDYRITNHEASIRPSSFDRRPLIGSHNKLKNLYILNGLGTRGILLAPYMSQCLINNIYKDIPIPNEININRL